MSFDPAEVQKAVRRLSKADRILANVIRDVGPFALKTEPGGYEVLVRSILSQQISTAAAKNHTTSSAGFIAVKTHCGEGDRRFERRTVAVPGISQQKRSYLRDLTRHTLDRTLNFRTIASQPDEDVIETLIQVKGIGRWTAQMYLMFSLGRPDVFAVGDLGIRNAMKRHYALDEKPKPSELEAIAAVWAPHRSIASWYLWRSLEQKVTETKSPV